MGDGPRSPIQSSPDPESSMAFAVPTVYRWSQSIVRLSESRVSQIGGGSHVRQGIKVFDADAHVIYPPDLWPRFLDKRYTDRVGVRQPVPGFETYNPVVVDGRWTQSDTILYGQFQKYIDWTKDDMIAKYGDDLVLGGFTGDRVARALAVDGIDLSVVYGPEYDLWFDGIDPDIQAAMVRAYNRWGEEMRETSGGRVHTAGPIPLQDVTRAVTEIDHAYHQLGIRCFWARPDEFNHRTLGDRYYDPIWELLQDLDVAFATHEFMGLRGNSFGSDRFTGYNEWHIVVHPFEAMGAIVSMICHGVFERFPRLRVAYLEAGCGWLPSWLHRIDEHLEIGGREFPELTMSASEYFARNCWITTECEDPYVADVIGWMGDDRILFESDFPHPDSKFPNTTQEFLNLCPDRISLEAKRKVLWDNPVDFYRFPESYYPVEFTEANATDPS
jgi:predicted TIM-barrel fold metal-dependent hydrolase